MDTTANKPMPSYTTHRKSDWIWNTLTFVVLIGTICMAGAFAYIYLNPNSNGNPFFPGPVSVEAVQASATPVQEETATPGVVASEPGVPTGIPVILVPTAVEATPTDVPTLEVTPLEEATYPVILPSKVYFPFELRGNIAALASTLIYPDKGCDWMGIGGQTFDLQGSPLVGASIQVGGWLNGENVNLVSLTGTARWFGEAGYEFYLGGQPVASYNSMWVQLLDQAGLALSEKVYFDTYDDCEKNLVIINFRQIR